MLALALLSRASARTLAKLKVSLVLASAQLLVGPVWFAEGEPDGAYKKLSMRLNKTFGSPKANQRAT